MKKQTILFFTFSLAILLTACKKNSEKTNISAYNDDESHNMGLNCMNCHNNGGKGKGTFQVAGTVYDSLQSTTYPNTTVKLYTDINGGGQLKYTIEVDALGNFYTTEAIDFGSGLYPAVVGNNGTRYMSSKITNGACNSCHGVSTGKIWTK